MHKSRADATKKLGLYTVKTPRLSRSGTFPSPAQIQSPTGQIEKILPETAQIYA